MAREEKTNAMRLLDRAGLPYEALFYPSDGQPRDAGEVALLLGVPAEQVFKTLVLAGAGGHYVCVIPGPRELDLKKAAAAFGVKSLRMLHVQEIKPATGYVRGGCSPIGMKKALPTALDRAALSLDDILVSAGQIGAQLRLAPGDLLQMTQALAADLCR